MGLRTLFCPALLLICGGVAASATSYQVTTSGTFNSSIGSSPDVAPNGTFTLSFDLDSNPAVRSSDAGARFDAVVSNVNYTLNGSSVLQAGDVKFFNLASSVNGGFLFCFTQACSTKTPLIEFSGPQLYSGPEAAPTMLTGSFTPTSAAYLDYVGARNDLAASSAINIAAVGVTPEPSSFVLLGTGLLGICGVVRRNFA